VNLRHQGVRGGVYLALREAFGIGVRLVGVLLVTRAIGPSDYGVYVTAAAISGFTASVAQLGLEAYLVRRPEEPTTRTYDQATTLLLMSSAVAVAVVGAGLLVWRALGGSSTFFWPSVVLLLVVPFNVLWAPAQGKIERDLQYRRMAWLELGGDLSLYVTSVAIAVVHPTVWAPVAGYWVWQVFLLGGSQVLAGLRPGIAWDRVEARRQIGFGLRYSAASWAAKAKDLVGPVVVGAVLGSTAVGIVAVALRVVDTLGFVLRASQRIGVAVLAKVQDAPERFARGLSEAMSLQVLTLGVPLVAFGFVVGPAVRLLFGPAWIQAADIYPFVALAALVSSVFLLEVSALTSLDALSGVIVAQSTRVIVLAAVSFGLTTLIGLEGYGWGELAACFGLALVHLFLVRRVPLRLGVSVWWIIAFGPPLFVHFTGPKGAVVLLLPAIAIAVVRATRLAFVNAVRTVWSAVAQR
jgi:PST family polysaccharide transporter